MEPSQHISNPELCFSSPEGAFNQFSSWTPGSQNKFKVQWQISFDKTYCLLRSLPATGNLKVWPGVREVHLDSLFEQHKEIFYAIEKLRNKLEMKHFIAETQNKFANTSFEMLHVELSEQKKFNERGTAWISRRGSRIISSTELNHTGCGAYKFLYIILGNYPIKGKLVSHLTIE